ncbi:MAG: ligase-associated DNA damage response endonuclease PdeM [Burkholderiales bacterium]|nr:ligase-associated DNA damage response endonuclease PdeM [Burkholderiales bacterium]
MRIEVAGDELVLCRERAIHWPARATLLVADAHFGKAATFRARGVPVPEATTAANLAALDRLIERHALKRIVFLGDFLHAREARNRATQGALAAWRERHAALKLILVAGNHDHHAGDPSAGLRIERVEEPLVDGPFALCHHPQASSAGYVLAGHLHPAYRLSGKRDALRLPCFWLGPNTGVLPAFGDFTGGHAITPAPGDRLFVTTPGAVHEVPIARVPAF